MQKIIILGGGYAGVLTAKKLAKRLKKETASITLIDRNPFHTMLTELHEVAAARVQEDAVRIEFRKIFAGRNVEVVMDEITGADLQTKTLRGRRGDYTYDFLVVATGSRPAFFHVEGAEEHSFRLWSYDDAVRLRRRIFECFDRAARLPEGEERKKLLSFYVVGAGFTGIEMAGELGELIPFLCREHGIPREEVTVSCVDLLDRPVPALPEKLSGKVERRLKKMGVNLYLSTSVAKITPDSITLEGNNARTGHPAGTVVWAAGIEGSAFASTLSDRLDTENRGRIRTDEYLRAAGHEDIYVGGDNIYYVPEGSEDPVPQMVENAEHSADVISRNLIAAIVKDRQPVSYHPKFHGMMVSVGGRYAVAHVGFGNFFALPSFFAMLCKHFINIVYLIQVAGWYRMVYYLGHEFFHIRNRRSILGGHFSSVTPDFLMVPLRIYLGFFWMMEAWQKIADGWLSSPQLKGYFASADQFFNTILKGAPVSGADAAASATVAATESVGDVLFHWDFFGWFDALLVHGSDYAFRFKFAPMDWFVNKVILSGDGMQQFFQAVIIVSEILIGLSLIGGLFTFLSNAYSLALQAMFIMTTGLYMSTWWMIFTAIALLFGSGSVLGLDYYVMPALKRWWSRLPWIRKWYFYHD